MSILNNIDPIISVCIPSYPLRLLRVGVERSGCGVVGGNVRI